jgi:uncharacterized hydrophobic protein (TIGR00271 family)
MFKIPLVPAEHEAAIQESVHASAGFTRTYFILLVLSTMIATLGLVANSAATVIGAMIVAPLMGPILGTGLSFVQGDAPNLQRALRAEFAGVVLCLLASCLLGMLIGIDNIDFAQSEIVARTRPTLLDLAVGLAAGLVGAFATVNRKVSGSIAGVSIAVALVPPLCTAGLCAASSLWTQSLGAFMLFLANFLAIQLAAVVVFGLSGMGHWTHPFKDPQLRRAVGLNLGLFCLTGAFLWNQFHTLVRERQLSQATRKILLEEIRKVPGAHLDSLRVQRVEGRVDVRALTRAPREMPASFAAHAQSVLKARLNEPVDLEVGTVLSSYVNPTGSLYRDDEKLLGLTEKALNSALEQFSGADLEFFRTTQSPDQLFVSIRSPYVFDAELVEKLRQSVQSQLQKPIHLTVRTTLSQLYTESGPVATEWNRPLSPQQTQQGRVESVVRQEALQLLTTSGGWIESIRVEALPQVDQPGQFHFRVQCLVSNPKPIPQPVLDEFLERLRSQTEDPSLQLQLRCHLGQEYQGYEPSSMEAALKAAQRAVLVGDS